MLSSWLTRRDLARNNGTFRCNARVELGEVPGLEPHYHWQWHRASWAHDVLLIHRGRLRAHVIALPVDSAGGLSQVDSNHITVQMSLDSGAVIRVMADSASITALVGPFLMAELDHVAKAKPSH